MFLRRRAIYSTRRARDESAIRSSSSGSRLNDDDAGSGSGNDNDSSEEKGSNKVCSPSLATAGRTGRFLVPVTPASTATPQSLSSSSSHHNRCHGGWGAAAALLTPPDRTAPSSASSFPRSHPGNFLLLLPASVPSPLSLPSSKTRIPKLQQRLLRDGHQSPPSS